MDQIEALKEVRDRRFREASELIGGPGTVMWWALRTLVIQLVMADRQRAQRQVAELERQAKIFHAAEEREGAKIALAMLRYELSTGDILEADLDEAMRLQRSGG